jgi:hypothetical protein
MIGAAPDSSRPRMSPNTKRISVETTIYRRDRDNAQPLPRPQFLAQ